MHAFRTLVISLTLLSAPILTMAQEAAHKAAVAPPASVQRAFAKQFPTAPAARWEKEGVLFEAEFTLKSVKTSVVYAATGEFKEIEEAMAVSTLPAPAAAYLAKNYAGQKVAEAARIKDAAGTVSWEAEVGGRDLIFDAAGQFLRIEAEDGDDGKDGKDGAKD